MHLLSLQVARISLFSALLVLSIPVVTETSMPSIDTHALPSSATLANVNLVDANLFDVNLADVNLADVSLVNESLVNESLVNKSFAYASDARMTRQNSLTIKDHYGNPAHFVKYIIRRPPILA